MTANTTLAWCRVVKTKSNRTTATIHWEHKDTNKQKHPKIKV